MTILAIVCTGLITTTLVSWIAVLLHLPADLAVQVGVITGLSLSFGEERVRRFVGW